jgi:RNA polymerase sigma-54 factor
MALSPRLQLRQSQSLTMTPQLQQAIKLLAMSNHELVDYVSEEVEKNPLLEMRGTPPPGPSSGRSSGRFSGGTGGDGDILDTIAARPTLYDHLHDQIGVMRMGPLAAEAAHLVVDELDEDGYFRAGINEVAERHRLKAADVARGLARVQSCDPAGVGARNLKECFAPQLREKNRLDPAIQSLLDNLGLAATSRQAELLAICGVDASDMADMLEELRALDPKPGLLFTKTPVQVAIPDVYAFRPAAGVWNVELNTETLPRVLVNNAYSTRLGKKNDDATRIFISECSASANWLVRALEQRARTILSVASEIVKQQERFFDQGVSQLRPLTQKAVADKLKIHESTVSRVTAGKYLSCDHGILEFKYFFSSSIQGVSDGQTFSATAVQERIRLLVQHERNAGALSDDDIVSALKSDGIDIARRTVAKYRGVRGIPSSVQRRRLKAAFAAK